MSEISHFCNAFETGVQKVNPGFLCISNAVLKRRLCERASGKLTGTKRRGAVAASIRVLRPAAVENRLENLERH